MSAVKLSCCMPTAPAGVGRIRAKAAAKRRGAGGERQQEKGKEYIGSEEEPKSETLCENKSIRGSQKQSGGKSLMVGEQGGALLM